VRSATLGPRHTAAEDLDVGPEHVRQSPSDGGTVELIVRRPALGEREVLAEGRLRLDVGLEGDTWDERTSTRTEDGSPHPDMQLNVMNARAVDLVADGERDRWPLAGDQLYVDLDLSEANLPPGTRLALGTAVIEVTDQPHTGCAKFTQRFGLDAFRYVNSDAGQSLRLRGLNAKVVQAGSVRPGDSVKKL
jgi:MOSC domain